MPTRTTTTKTKPLLGPLSVARGQKATGTKRTTRTTRSKRMKRKTRMTRKTIMTRTKRTTKE